MATTDQFKKGMFLIIDDGLCIVEERKLKTQGRQGGLIILTYRNVETKQISTKTVKAGTKYEYVQPEYVEMQYSYADDSNVYFMDMETFETVGLSVGLLDDYVKFLKEGDRYVVMIHENKPISIRKNQSVELRVTEAADAVKGNTSSSATKIVTTETGYKLSVPMFVSQGDVLVINTETGEYKSRKS